MMHPVIQFVLKSIIVSGTLIAWYLLALKNRRLHSYNRFFLLLTLYASIQVPLLSFKWSPVLAKPPAMLTPAVMVLHTLNGDDAALPVMRGAPAEQIDLQITALGIAALVSLGLLVITLMRVVWVLRAGRRYPATVVSGVKLVQTNLPKAPFSFLNTIFWRDGLSPETGSGRMILLHELAHIRQKHTYDKLACQLLSGIFWMNPCYWIIQKELAMVHEFLADKEAIMQDNGIPEEEYTAVFAKMLLYLHQRPGYFTPEHQFFSSSIKRRLIMLQSNKPVRASLLRRIAVLPLITGSIFLFAFSPRRAATAAKTADRQIVLVVDAGHGGNDAGCRSGSLTEKELALKVARRIAELAPRYNVKVHLTRKEDQYLTLQERVAFSNALHPDGFISIHIGDYPGEEPPQATFDIAVNTKNAQAGESERLAYAIFKAASRPEWIQKNVFSEKNPYVLLKSAAASVLMEIGNIRNQEQLQHIADDAKLDELCSHILEGVVDAHR